jgi:predicted RNA binding protein YcfA (HicA-like mRNA interferase family)
MKVRNLIQLLTQVGCNPTRIEGSHQVWRTPKNQSVPIVVNHKNDEVSRLVLTTVRRVLRSEGIDLREVA